MSKNMQDMMQQAQMLQRKMEEIQSKLEVTEITGYAGGGSVAVTMNGKMDANNISISPEVFQDQLSAEEIKKIDLHALEDLILAAFNDTKKKAESRVQDEMQSITGGMLPDLGALG